MACIATAAARTPCAGSHRWFEVVFRAVTARAHQHLRPQDAIGIGKGAAIPHAGIMAMPAAQCCRRAFHQTIDAVGQRVAVKREIDAAHARIVEGFRFSLNTT